MRDSVLIYRSQIEALRALPPEQFKAAALAICDYAMNGTTEETDPVAVAMLRMAQPLIDDNNRKYENGKKGGRPKPNQNQTITTQEPDRNQTVTTQEPNHNQTITTPEPPRNLNDKGEMLKDKDIELFSNENNLTRGRVIEAWNTLEPLGITPVKAIAAESKRGQMLNARVRQYGETAVIDAIKSVKDQAFLHGQEWFTFDWFIKPNNFIKVQEGNYKNHTQPKRSFTAMTGRDNTDKYAELEAALLGRATG